MNVMNKYIYYISLLCSVYVHFVMFAELSWLLEGENNMKKKEYFTKFPNKYIQGNIKTKFGVSRKFYITYILIDKYRSYEDYSWITIRKVLEFYGYKTHRNKPKAFGEILDVLEYMVNNCMIEVVQDLDSINYDTGIEIKIIPENFDSQKNFSKLTSSQYNTILMADSSLNRENILMAFLYINSYIGCRKKNEDDIGSENDYKNPEAFYQSLKHMSEELSMSKDTLNKCLSYLTESNDKHDALLIKREIGSTQPSGYRTPKQLPNVYVLNRQGYEQEIEWAIQKMLELYDVDCFGQTKCENEEN